MRRRARRLAGLAAALCAALPGAAARAHPGEPDHTRLHRAAAAHPEDPDLAWAAVRAHLDVAPAEALAGLEAFRLRWPGRRPEAASLQGRLLYDLGRDAEALAVVDARLAEVPDDGSALFVRGLVLRRQDRLDEADAALERAAALEPELAVEALVLRSLARHAAGETGAARDLLARADELDPESELARSARVLVGGPRPPAWEVAAHGGVEYDSNVTLDAGVALAGLPNDERDLRLAWGTAVALRPLRGERLGLTLGYRYDESDHLELSDYDLRSHDAFASLFLRAGERSALRLDARYTRWALGGERYLQTARVQPSLFVGLGPAEGLSRVWGVFERRRYQDRPSLSSLERDGLAFGGGLEHGLTLPRTPARITLGASWTRDATDGERDALGFDAAYDRDRTAGHLRLAVPTVWQIVLYAGLTYAYDAYAHRNLFDFLTDDGVGRGDGRVRRDHVLDGRVVLVRPLGRWLQAELAWQATRQSSNVDVYDYGRHRVGFTLRAWVR